MFRHAQVNCRWNDELAEVYFCFPVQGGDPPGSAGNAKPPSPTSAGRCSGSAQTAACWACLRCVDQQWGSASWAGRQVKRKPCPMILIPAT